eukprot:TRINITY_DN37821_c0_g1_i2.p5 TRINITY_DN37821_c0_g1~~TRINITY_DN37821_c0_g1_i2.p5  ORF type:complete len:132 (-),score=10.97 TRINITY_DN37821_c0_g1_i2:100-495(-)
MQRKQYSLLFSWEFLGGKQEKVCWVKFLVCVLQGDLEQFLGVRIWVRGFVFYFKVERLMFVVLLLNVCVVLELRELLQVGGACVLSGLCWLAPSLLFLFIWEPMLFLYNLLVSECMVGMQFIAVENVASNY